MTRHVALVCLLVVSGCSKSTSHTPLHAQHIGAASKAMDEEIENVHHAVETGSADRWATWMFADYKACRSVVLGAVDGWFTRWEAYHQGQDPRCGLAEQLRSVAVAYNWVYQQDQANGNDLLFEQHHRDIACNDLEQGRAHGAVRGCAWPRWTASVSTSASVGRGSGCRRSSASSSSSTRSICGWAASGAPRPPAAGRRARSAASTWPSSRCGSWNVAGSRAGQFRRSIVRYTLEPIPSGTRLTVLHPGFAGEEDCKNHADRWELKPW